LLLMPMFRNERACCMSFFAATMAGYIQLVST
jgi:hypothetical protein